MTQKINTQICIIGGGPGGATTSAYLSKNKIDHVLIEAEVFPRSKPCGDTISIHELNRIKEIFPNSHSELLKKGTLYDIEGVNFFIPTKKAYKYTFPNLAHFKGSASSFTIQREAFDHLLLSEVKLSKHATVYEGVRALEIIDAKDGITIQTTIGEVYCKLVVVASGCKSLFAQKYSNYKVENNHYSLGLRGYFKGVKLNDEHYSELIFDKKIFFGGLYICPLGDDLYNVNMVIKYGSLAKKKEGFRELFTDFISQNPLVAEKFKNATLVGKMDGHGLLLGSKKRTLSKNRTLFVGDSAGLIDIVTANGIPQAMKSAKIAVDTIVSALSENNFSASKLKEYDKRVYKLLKSEMRIGSFIIKLTRFKLISDLCIKVLPYLTNKLFIELTTNLIFYAKNPFKNLRKSSVKK